MRGSHIPFILFSLILPCFLSWGGAVERKPIRQLSATDLKPNFAQEENKNRDIQQKLILTEKSPLEREIAKERPRVAKPPRFSTQPPLKSIE